MRIWMEKKPTILSDIVNLQPTDCKNKLQYPTSQNIWPLNEDIICLFFLAVLQMFQIITVVIFDIFVKIPPLEWKNDFVEIHREYDAFKLYLILYVGYCANIYKYIYLK